jgi:branched-chain amino acid transport system substrate-binding protein
MRKSLIIATLGMGLLSAPSAIAQIKVGVGTPLTGSNAAYGLLIRAGAEQAVADINASGGVLGQKLELVIGDDAADPRQGVSVANKFVNENVKWVIGHFNSGVSIPASEVYLESGIVQISPASTNPAYTDRKMWNTIRTCGRDDQQAVVAGEIIAKDFKDRKVAIIHDKTPYGKGLADETKKAMNTGGVKEVLYEGLNTGEKDFAALISKLKQNNIDLIYYGGLYTEAGLIVRQMADQGLKTQFMAGEGILSDEFPAIAGPAAVGTLMTSAPDPRKNPNAAETISKLAAKGINADIFSLYTYTGFQVLKQAAEQAKTIDPKKVAETITSGMKFQTVVGEISFDKKGDRSTPDYVLYTWKPGADGKITFVQN